MNAVGIDVSKGKSMVVVMRPLGEIVEEPFEVPHTASGLKELADSLKKLNGETKIIMEYTGKYYQSIARHLVDSGFFVSVINAKLIHDYGNNSMRKVKTDKADSVKIANYGLTNWHQLRPYSKEDNTRLLLKSHCRQFDLYTKTKVALRNNLIALIDQTFPDVEKLFGQYQTADGHEKRFDFIERFWHCKCVTKYSKSRFIQMYNSWCAKHRYNRSSERAILIYEHAKSCIHTLPYDESTKQLIELSVRQLNFIFESLLHTQKEMYRLASQLPEFPVVIAMNGVGKTLAPQLMAEIGDVRRFHRKESLVAYAGVDSQPFQSGVYSAKGRRISKRGSPKLRGVLFQVMQCLIQNLVEHDKVYQFLDRKRAEGKHFYVYSVAGCNKFLRIYYARVKEYLNALEA